MKLYNSLSLIKEDFIPREDKRVLMYVCGITPYDTTHLGHAFTYIFFDTLLRYLRYQGYNVNYAQNVTDINDRDNDLLKRAQEQHVTWNKLAQHWTERFLEDMKILNWIMPDHYLWASQNIPQMITVIKNLLDNGWAYEINGGIYLDIEKDKDFGKLSRIDKEKMIQKAKDFEEDLTHPDKRNPLDITLWKPTVANQPVHIPSFDSPFGKGRPGWHVECSAMAIASLGEQIDIHGGGIDLIYPHHENEIAQSEGATGKKPFAKYWLHTAYVSYKGEKMSKSLGNIIMIADLLKQYTPNTIRYLLLSHHYRESWEFHEDDLRESQEQLAILEQATGTVELRDDERGVAYEQAFFAAMNDDMNTPEALKALIKSARNTKIYSSTKKMFNLLGFV